MDLYRFFDSDDRLLYIGISLSAAKRAAEHRDSKQWWPDVARMNIEHLGAVPRSTAEHVEASAIRAERPLWNRTHSAYELPTTPAQTTEMVWFCGVCGGVIADREGTVQRLFRWRAVHDSCAPEKPEIAFVITSGLRSFFDVLAISLFLGEKAPESIPGFSTFILGAIREGWRR